MYDTLIKQKRKLGGRKAVWQENILCIDMSPSQKMGINITAV